MKQGILYIIATPIGNLKDITQRALDILAQVDLVAAEDTRHSKKLLQHYHIYTPLFSLHADKEKIIAQDLIDKMLAGHSIALISDAGTPLVSDPGRLLVELAHQHGIQVVPLPGPCAAITALSASGFHADAFLFLGFLSTQTGARHKALENLKNETRTMVFYEAPHRIVKFVDELIDVFGVEREIVIARELTKQFETIKRGGLSKIRGFISSDVNQQKGEFVVLVKGETNLEEPDVQSVESTLKILMKELSLKQAVKLAAEITGVKKNKVYELALKL